MRRTSAATRATRVVVMAASLLAACTTTTSLDPVPPPIRERPDLLSPSEGYPLVADSGLEARVHAIHDRLRTGEELEAVEADGSELLADNPGFHPAAVLLAQVDFLHGEDREVIERLEPIAAELPGYVACQELLGRAAERLDDVLVAYQAFQPITETSVLAARRAAELRDRAREIVVHRFEEALARGQLDDARLHRDWLEEWIGDERAVVETTLAIHVAEGDRESELEAVCRLAEIEPSRELAERCGALHIEIGDVRRGLKLFEELAARHPDDPGIADQLERAKFRWRLELLPPLVRELGRKRQLERSDLAALLYWMVPQVRYSQIVDPPIATDILDHPRRDEILRVANLGLMTVDETLHRFDPSAPATRVMAFAGLLRLMGLSEQDLICLDGADVVNLAVSSSWVCDRAALCGMIPEAADCLPWATISGGEALDFFRHSLDLMGSGGAPR